MNSLGYAVLLTGFMTCLWATVAGFVAMAQKARAWLLSGTYAFTATAFFHGAASVVLMWGLMHHDFSNEYVFSYTDLDMDTVYVLSAFWAGEKGALMFWGLALSILGSFLVGKFRHAGLDSVDHDGATLGVLASCLLFFDLLMVFASNPFEYYVARRLPADGNGMNPLLQNPLMAAHPPFQLAGFVAFAIPFSLGVAALLTGRLDETFQRKARAWVLLAYALLTAGLVIGGLWAYVELGWGGFWGWDPVENAALLPWLSATALIHAMAISRRRRVLLRTVHALNLLTFVLTIFATFLTRSQLISSLHAFSDSVLGPYFVFYQGLLVLSGAILLIWRYSAMGGSRGVEHYLTREGMAVLNVLLFLGLTFVVLWGTLLPRLTESETVRVVLAGMLGGNSIDKPLTVGPSWFNKVAAPFAAVAALGMPLAMLLPYRRPPRRWRTLVLLGISTFFCGLAVVGSFVLRDAWLTLRLGDEGLSEAFHEAVRRIGPGWLASAFVFSWAAVLTLVVMVRDFFCSGAWTMRFTGRNAVWAVVGLIRRNPGRFGGHLAHFGVVLVLMALVGQMFKHQRKDEKLGLLDSLHLGPYTFVHAGVGEYMAPKGNYVAVQAKVAEWPRKRPLPVSVLKRLEAMPGVKEARSTEPPIVELTFEDDDARRRFLIRTLGQTVLSKDFMLASVSGDTLALSPKSAGILRIQPRVFHRLVTELRRIAQWLGPREIEVGTTPGDPTILVKVHSRQLLRKLARAFKAKGEETALVASVSVRRGKVLVLPTQGVSFMRPEMRFYAKFPNPTTEVDVITRPLEDVYLGAAPMLNTNAIQLTAMVNPLMWFMWTGSLILFLVCLLLSGLGFRRARI